MVIYKKVADIHQALENSKQAGKTIGFVPTMGALHKGHISLIEKSNRENDLTVCSIFVNPTQFNDKSDFEKYPTTIESDISLLHNSGCHILFLPTTTEIYPDNISLEQYDLGELDSLLEGQHRPGHFQGVCQVVHRLLNIIQPTNLYLGQKDYQQCKVIQKLIQLKGINTNLIIGSTVREESGLALSSRNLRLSEDGKNLAVAIYHSLVFIKENIASLPINEIEKKVTENLLMNGFTHVDYVSTCNSETLQSVSDYNPQTQLVALIAAFIEGVRLIDNMLIS